MSSFTNYDPVANQIGVQNVAGSVYNISGINFVQASDPLIRIFNVPFERDEGFVQRQNIFDSIASIQTRKEPIVLYGLGGVGKSQIAIEYAYRFHASNPNSHIIWIYAGSAENIVQTAQDVVRQLQLPGYQDPKADFCQLLFEWLTKQNHREGKDSQHEWLLIVDNLDDLNLLNTPLHRMKLQPEVPKKSLRHYLPRQFGERQVLLVTTRHRDVVRALHPKGSGIDIGTFSPDQSRLLIGRKLEEEQDEDFENENMRRLTDKLGDIPLAISQAAAFINRSQMSINDFLSLLEQDDKQLAENMSTDLQDSRREPGWPNSVFRTWKISFDAIRKDDSGAAKMLETISMLDGQRMDKWFLAKTFEMTTQFAMSIGTLLGYDLVSKIKAEDAYTTHPLVQASVRYWIQQEGRFEEQKDKIFHLLAENFPETGFENWTICKSLMSHTKMAFNREDLNARNCPAIPQLLYNVACYELQVGLYFDAAEHSEQCYEISNNHYGEKERQTIRGLNLFAATLTELGNYDRANQLLRQALSTSQSALGETHQATLDIMFHLAIALFHLGKYREAEDITVRGLVEMEKAFGPGHKDTLAMQEFLGKVLVAQGRYEQAQRQLQRTLESWEKSRGWAHWDTLKVASALADVLERRGNLIAAETMQRRALEGFRTLGGEDHVETLKSMGILATTLLDLGKYSEAEILYLQAMAGYKRAFGPDHLHSLNYGQQLARLYMTQNRLKEAEALELQVVERFKRFRGAENPETLLREGTLGQIYRAEGRFQEAVEILERVVQISKRVSGEENPNTIGFSGALADVYVDLKRWEDAERLKLWSLDVSRRVLGEEHPDTLSILGNLGRVYKENGRLTEAEQTYTQALNLSKRILGEDHPSSIVLMYNLLSTYLDEQKWKEAEELCAVALETSQRVNGEENFVTLRFMHESARLKFGLGQKQEAIDTVTKCLVLQEKILGPEHPHTIKSTKTLAEWTAHKDEGIASGEDNEAAASSTTAPTESQAG